MNNSAINKIDPIQRIEISLREIISEVLSAEVGSNWIEDEEHGLGKERAEELKAKIKNEEKRRYTIIVDQDLLSYTYFKDLRKIIMKNKNIGLFKKVFKDWDAFRIYLKKVEYLRNPAKHHRLIYPHEMLLLEGIVGEIDFYISTWHMGASFNVKKYRFGFFEYVETEGKENNQILDFAKRRGKGWIKIIKKYLLNKGIEESRIEVEEKDFEGNISAENIEAHWQTSSTSHPTSKINGVNCKSIFINVWCSPSSMSELDDLIEFIGKKYAIFAFELDGRIDIENLKKKAMDLAELTPSTYQNHESVEYGISYFSRIGAKNIDQKTGEIFIQNSHKYYFKNAHNIISPGTILSYLTGNMPRRLIISLIKSSV